VLLFSDHGELESGVLVSLKPGSHLFDKHNTSDISTSISIRKKEHVPYDEGLTLETSAFESLYGGQFIFLVTFAAKDQVSRIWTPAPYWSI